MLDNLNIGDLAEPVTALIEKISGAIGIGFEPRRIVRKAKAEAQAAAIMAHSAIEVTEIEQRGLERLIWQEGRKQENIESITMQATPLLLPEADPARMEEDWIADFFSKCANVSDSEMQSLWAKILAGEANSPGSFSKRTVETVSLLEKQDAQLFNDFCQFIWVRTEDSAPFITGWDLLAACEGGFTTATRQHLAEAGLLHPTSINFYAAPDTKSYQAPPLFSYHGEVVYADLASGSEKRKSIGEGVLTRAGQELFRVSSPQFNTRYMQDSLDFWERRGVRMKSP